MGKDKGHRMRQREVSHVNSNRPGPKPARTPHLAPGGGGGLTSSWAWAGGSPGGLRELGAGVGRKESEACKREREG